MQRKLEQPLIRETLALWQGRYPELLSEDDAQHIVDNMSDLFHLLEEWD